jgi:hypothetical protein
LSNRSISLKSVVNVNDEVTKTPAKGYGGKIDWVNINEKDVCMF